MRKLQDEQTRAKEQIAEYATQVLHTGYDKSYLPKTAASVQCRGNTPPTAVYTQTIKPVQEEA